MFDPCDATTWSESQREAMRRCFPPGSLAEKIPYVSGECGKWILFTEGVPDDENDILVTNGRIVSSALWSFSGLSFPDAKTREEREDYEGYISEITHWMKYPDPPSK